MGKTEGEDRTGEEHGWRAQETNYVGVCSKEDRGRSEETVGCVEGKAEGRIAIRFPYKLESPARPMVKSPALFVIWLCDS